MLPYSIRRTAINPSVFQRICRSVGTHKQKSKVADIIDNSRRQAKGQRPIKDPPQEQAQDILDDGTKGISWYEQDAVTGERRRVPGDPDEMEKMEIQRELRKVNRELKAFEDTKDGRPNEAILELLSASDRKKVLQTWEEQQEKKAAVLEGLLIDYPDDAEPEHMPTLDRFNELLATTAVNPSAHEMRTDLHKQHAVARRRVPGFLNMLSDKAWRVLWDLLPPDVFSRRKKLLLKFTDDLLEAGKQLSVNQRCARIEVLWAQGDRARAYRELRQLDSLPRADTPKPYETIISMCADMGDVNRGLATLKQMFTHFPQSNPRIALPLISALANAGKHQVAFALYLMLCSKLGSEMGSQDFDQVSIAFLATGRKDLALATFRDMVLQMVPLNHRDMTGSEARTLYTAEYQAVTNRMRSLQNLSESLKEVNTVNLTALTALPRAFQNKFFYASWLKRLIGDGHVEAAGQVVELMYERGCKPDAVHVNGIIGLLFRNNDPESVRRGEKLGWAMIKARLQFVSQRRQRLLEREVKQTQGFSIGYGQSSFKNLEDALEALSEGRIPETADLHAINATTSRDITLDTGPNIHAAETSSVLDGTERRGQFGRVLSYQMPDFDGPSHDESELPHFVAGDFQEPSVPAHAPLWETREVPIATLETFNVLIAKFLIGKRFSKMNFLYYTLQQAEIKPDIYFINHMLYKSLYDPRYGSTTVWNRFVHLAERWGKEEPLHPDMGTWEVLWDTEVRHVRNTRHDEKARERFPGPRQLFAKMAGWATERAPLYTYQDGVKKPDDTSLAANSRYHPLTETVYWNILETFKHEKDFAAILVTVNALFKLFRFVPREQELELICLCVTGTPLGEQGPLRIRARGRVRYPSKELYKTEAKMENIKQILRIVYKRRENRATGRQEDYDENEDEQQEFDSRDIVNYLSEFLRLVLINIYKSPEEAEAAVRAAATEMGVGHLNIGDISAIDMAGDYGTDLRKESIELGGM